MKTTTLDRRDFLRLGGFSLAATVPLFLRRTALAIPAERGDNPKTLVVLQLSGGNDGLSTVVPYSDPLYGNARSTTRLGENAVLRINERVGLHPNLKDLKELYDAGQMTIVQGASYPNPTRSHFEAMDIWHAGDKAGARRGSGWLGRAIDAACGNELTPLHSVNLGGRVPLALHGERSRPVALQNPESFQWRGNGNERPAFGKLNMPEEEMLPVRPVDYLRRVAANANQSSEVIRQATQGYRASTAYPANNRFAEELRLVAAMIAARLDTRIFYVSLGGFDTHANQRGKHDNLMRTFSTAVGAFMTDLRAQGLLGDVLVMSFSEFGRRVKENGSRGTDHGVAGPMFFFGTTLRGGLVGEHPSLERLVKGDLAMTTDFRQAYASVLDGWLGAASEKVLGDRWQPLDLFSRRARV